MSSTREISIEGEGALRLSSCQSTLSLAIGKEENKIVFFKTTYKKMIDMNRPWWPSGLRHYLKFK